MTAPLIVAQDFYAGRQIETAEPKRLSKRGLYHSHLGLFGFQIDGVARTFHQWTVGDGRPETIFAIWATGVGKTHLGMAATAMAFEDDLIDLCIVVCESDKVDDWARKDFPRYTDLSVDRYLGDPKRRAKMRAEAPQVLVTTYETSRNDICTFRPKKGTPVVEEDGPLTEWLVNSNLRMAIVYDEATKLRTRSSKTHVAHDYLVNRVLRRSGVTPKMLALSATTIEDDPEDWYNVGRILAPNLVGTVAAFERDYVAAFNEFGFQRKPMAFKNLTRKDNWDGETVPLVERLAPIVIRKRKTDPDVSQHFPKMVEEPPTMVPLDGRLLDFYQTVTSTLDREADKMTNPYKAQAFAWQSFNVLRQIAGHPMSLLRSNGVIQRTLAETVGEKGLRALGAPKVDQMLRWAQRAGSDQGVIFTFFGQSVLPMLAEALQQNGYLISTNHGGLTQARKAQERDDFLSGKTQFYLSSDCGAKGLNLGCGSMLLHYEMPLLFSTFVQRSNRIHRIDSTHESVTVNALVAKDTIEDDLLNSLLRRNEWSDKFDLALDESAYDNEDVDPADAVLSADDRRRVLAMARRAA